MFLLHKQYGIVFRDNNNFIGLIKYFFGKKCSVEAIVIFGWYFSLLHIVVTVIKELIFSAKLFRNKFKVTLELFLQNSEKMLKFFNEICWLRNYNCFFSFSSVENMLEYYALIINK